MQLNIYLISHPIIQILSNSLNLNYSNFNNNKQNEYNKKYVGFFVLYEIFRRYIHIEKVYIKKISYIKQINKLDLNKEYYIITNLTNNYHIVSEIKILLPKIKIINTKEKIKLQQNTRMKQVIILEQNINNLDIIKLIEIVSKNNNINNIYIACIICNEKILQKIGQKYPKLQIYTTKII